MFHFMCLQIALLAEFLSTHVTFKRFSSSMYTHVYCYVTFGGKQFATNVASVSLNRNIDALVHCLFGTVFAWKKAGL